MIRRIALGVAAVGVLSWFLVLLYLAYLAGMAGVG